VNVKEGLTRIDKDDELKNVRYWQRMERDQQFHLTELSLHYEMRIFRSRYNNARDIPISLLRLLVPRMLDSTGICGGGRITNAQPSMEERITEPNKHPVFFG
jgi:hypothetical protein